jgi:hypothetical protein
MSVKWTIHGREFVNCNCAYGCPCQFNGLPTYGNCHAVQGIQIDKGHFGETSLDGLRVASIFTWPKAVHEGNGEVQHIIDKRANAAQREALLKIVTGENTDPGATVFAVFATTMKKVHEPVFADIDFGVDVEKRRAHLKVAGHIELKGEPIVNPVTNAEYRGRIDIPHGFEFTLAEVGRGWSKTQGPIRLDITDAHGHFAELHLNQSGMVH